MKIEYAQNPLATKIYLDEVDKLILKANVAKFLRDEDDITDMDTIENHYSWALLALEEEHCGDCTCVPCSCSKCWAEEWLEINTIPGLDNQAASLIQYYFKKYDSIKEVINVIQKHEPKIEEHNSNAFRAVRWLLNYKRQHNL